jgi:hypothetical protein
VYILHIYESTIYVYIALSFLFSSQPCPPRVVPLSPQVVRCCDCSPIFLIAASSAVVLGVMGWGLSRMSHDGTEGPPAP